MSQTGKEDPIKVHREGTSLYKNGKYGEAVDRLLQASRLYEKVGDFFDTPYTLFKAAECGFFLKDYETAIERFVKAADGALERASPPSG